jgi:hypothetical protein
MNTYNELAKHVNRHNTSGKEKQQVHTIRYIKTQSRSNYAGIDKDQGTCLKV